MNTTLYMMIALPVISGVLLLFVLRRDRRQNIVLTRLDALRGNEGKTAAPVSISRLRRAASRSMSVGALLPQQARVLLNDAFQAAGNRVGVVHLLLAALISAVVVNLFASRILTLDPVLVMLLSIALAAAAPVVVLRSAQSRHRNKFLNVFPDALDLIGRGIKAGLPVNEALVVAGQEIADPVGNELRRTLEQVQMGVPMIDALEKTADRVRIADFRFMVVALALQARTGGSLAETLGNLSSVIRARKHLRLKVRGLTAEAKVSALVLAALPFIVGGAMFALNRQLVLPLLIDPRGRFMVGVAFVSLLTGLTTMYVLIKRAVR
jgi:tight adherence protein B